MFQLNLTQEERDTLADILEYDYKQLRNEISNTENWEFKANLKKREDVIRRVLVALQPATKLA